MKYNVDEYTETIKFAYLPIKVQGRWIWFTKYIYSYKYVNENEWNTNLRNCTLHKSQSKFVLVKRKLLK